MFQSLLLARTGSRIQTILQTALPKMLRFFMCLFLGFCFLWVVPLAAQGPPVCPFDINISNTSPCPGDPVNLSISLPAQPGHAYLWTFSNTTPPPTQGPAGQTGDAVTTTFPFSTQAETWQIFVTDTLNGDTICREVASITVKDAPNVAFGANAVSMPDGILFDGVNVYKACGVTTDSIRVVLTNASTNTGSITGYMINWGDGSPLENRTNADFSSTMPVSHLFKSLGKYTVTLTATNMSGCKWSAVYTVFNGSNPLIGAGNLDPTVGLCPPDTLRFLITNAAGNPPGTEYTVYLNNVQYGPVFDDNNPLPDTLKIVFDKTSCGEPGNKFIFKIVAKNPCDESVATFEPIRVNGIPIAAITVTKPAKSCPGAVYVFNNSTTGSANASQNCNTTTNPVWTVTPGVSPTDWEFVNGTKNTDQTPRIKFNTPGIYTVRLHVTNGTACGDDETEVQVEIVQPPTADANAVFASQDSCAPVSLDLQNFSTGLGLSYQWTVIPAGGGTAMGVQFIPNDKAAEPTVNFSLPGTYTIRLTTTNDCDKALWDTIIHVYAPPTISPLNLGALSALCLSQTLNLSAAQVSILSTGGFQPGQLQYLWTFQDGTPPTSTDPYPTGISWTSTGNKIISLTVSNGCGSASVQGTIAIFEQEAADISPGAISVCRIDTLINLVATFPSGNLQPGIWQVDGVLSGNLINPTDYASGPHTIKFVAGVAPCTSESTISFNIAPLPMVDAGTDLSVCREDSLLVLQPVADFPGNWSGMPGGVVLQGDTIDLTQTPANQYVLQYQVTDPASGCSSTDVLNVDINQNTPLTLPADTTYCFFSDPVNLPLNGQPCVSWTGPGVSNNQFFPTDPNVVVDTAGTGVTNTVFLTSCNADNCIFQTTFDVHVLPPPDSNSVQAGPDRTLCIDDTVVLTGFPAGLGTYSGDGVVQGNPDMFIAAAAGIGLHNITYAYGGGNCGLADAAVFEVLDTAISILAPLPALCENALCVPLPGTAPNPVVWTGAGVVNNATFCPATAGAGGHLLSVTHVFTKNGVSCPYTKSLPVTVNPLPGSAFQIAGKLCEDELITFTNSTLNGQTFDWAFSDGRVSNQNSPQLTFPDGDYTATLISTTDKNCTDTAALNFHIRAKPSVSLQPDTTAGCGPLTINFTNQLAETDAAVLVISSPGSADIVLPATTTSYTFPPGPQAVVYTLTLKGWNNCDTVNSSTDITVRTKPYAGFGITYPQPCSGAELLLNVTSTGDPDISVLYTSENQIIPLNPPNTTALTFFTDTVQKTVGLWVVSENGCGTDTAFQEIMVNPADISALIASADTTHICLGDTVLLISKSTPGAEILWVDSFNGTSIGDTLLAVPTDTGIYRYTLYASGCGYDSMKIEFRVKPLPEFLLAVPAQICPGVPATFTVSSNAGAYTVSFPDGSTSQTKITTKTFDLPPGTYPVTATAVSFPDGCVLDWAGSMSVAPAPVARIAPTDSLCKGAPVALQNTGTPNTSCTWTIGSNTRDGCDISYTFEDAGLQTVILHVVSAAGCPDNDTTTVYVRKTPAAAFSAVLPVPPCAPDAVQFKNESVDFTDLLWSFDDGSTLQGTLNPKHDYQTGKIFSVSLIASYEGVCFDTAVGAVQLYGKPELDVQLRDTCTVAAGTALTVNTKFTNQVTVTGPAYQADGSYHPGLLPGTYNVLIRSSEGCMADTDVVVLKPNELFLKTAQDSFFLRLGESVGFDVQPNQTGVSFEWIPAMGLNNPTTNTPVATPFVSGPYVVVATNQRGCTKSDTLYVEVLIDRDSLVFIPNAFTPLSRDALSDGINDVFMIRSSNPAVTKIAFFRIYDRWGELMFEAGEDCLPNDPACGWDGLFRDREAQMGTYHYEAGILFLDSTTPYFLSGQMLLIR